MYVAIWVELKSVAWKPTILMHVPNNYTNGAYIHSKFVEVGVCYH